MGAAGHVAPARAVVLVALHEVADDRLETVDERRREPHRIEDASAYFLWPRAARGHIDDLPE